MAWRWKLCLQTFASAHPARIATRPGRGNAPGKHAFASAHPARIATEVFRVEIKEDTLCLGTSRTDCNIALIVGVYAMFFASAHPARIATTKVHRV